jgi:hypothetical protein
MTQKMVLFITTAENLKSYKMEPIRVTMEFYGIEKPLEQNVIAGPNYILHPNFKCFYTNKLITIELN